MTELLSVKCGSWRLWLRCRDIAPLGNLNLGQHARTNMKDLFVDVILGNKSDFVDVIPENENGSCVNAILGNRSESCVGVILGKQSRR